MNILLLFSATFTVSNFDANFLRKVRHSLIFLITYFLIEYQYLSTVVNMYPALDIFITLLFKYGCSNFQCINISTRISNICLTSKVKYLFLKTKMMKKCPELRTSFRTVSRASAVLLHSRVNRRVFFLQNSLDLISLLF